MSPLQARLLLLFGFLGSLELVCRLGWVERTTLVAPTEMVAGAARILASPAYRSDIAVTLSTVAGAAGLAIVIGFFMGYALHRLPRLRRAADPFLASYYAVPTFVFYPLLIVLFGLNRWSLVALGFIFAVVAMALNAITGFERVPRTLIRTAHVLRMSRMAELWRITVPCCIPYLCTGIKLTVAYSFIGVIAGEFVLSGAGLGHRIAFAYNNFDSPTMYGLMVILLTIVVTLNMSLFAFEKRVQRRWGLAAA